MSESSQLSLLRESSVATQGDDWTFNGASTRELTHCYHDYPARMIPQIASKLLDMFATQRTNLLFDPYCGTGTSLVEAMTRGISASGTDLNPLARLIAKAKTSTPELEEVDRTISAFNKFALSRVHDSEVETKCVPGISRLDFWFKPSVISRLSRIRSFVERIRQEPIRLFFQVAFSETVRESSNTRNNEFKLYRYDPTTLERYNPDVLGIMAQKLARNRKGLGQLAEKMLASTKRPVLSLFDFNSVDSIPDETVRKGSVDIVVTSPPYGDSHTTVAYGQYSRLSAAWLGLAGSDKIDSKLMGSKVYRESPHLPESHLEQSLQSVREVDPKRAQEVLAFYVDLYASIRNVAEVVRPKGYACYVVGNRKVKGIVLPTDSIVQTYFETHGFDHVSTFHRSIPNKRMPARNSPTNASGIVDSTMVSEYIVVMRRRGRKTGK